MLENLKILEELEQGSEIWLNLRKTKITSTDAAVIMGVSPWKTKLQLYHDKTSNALPSPANERMKRGLELEPIARDLFALKTGLMMRPCVMIRDDWAMASLDGRETFENSILEIKCPGDKDHEMARKGEVPSHYYPQIQHQIYVSGVEFCYYFSFDGFDGISIKIKKNEEYIAKLVEEEKKFYECLMKKIPPEISENDYMEREDLEWESLASRWKEINCSIKELEKEEEILRNQIISLAGESNTRGAGISLSSFQKKGNVDYSKIPEISNIDLEKYRKPSTKIWRIISF